MHPTAAKIRAIAARQARIGGYSAFSFREIAKELGIKSASVHYHFPTKAVLSAELLREETDRFLRDLPDSRDPWQPADAILAVFVDRYRRLFGPGSGGSVLASFGAVAPDLPLEVRAELKDCITRIHHWLVPPLARRGERDPAGTAFFWLASLDGAVTISRSLEADFPFDAAAARLLRR